MPERADILVEPLEFENGAFKLPTKPGLQRFEFMLNRLFSASPFGRTRKAIPGVSTKTRNTLGVELNKDVFDQYVYQPRDLDHFTPSREIVL